ncbi:choice-of-anchor J domain-containing protein [Bacteroides congonensis]|uniref:choice-of-anchor J domain-containing protein n=1 Tax=Bacteroides congonensis TaxID=1871006 RepID=UPI0009335CA5|nr:choice-of-anchor J domain-containing protein [Bacteroides congonensis]
MKKNLFLSIVAVLSLAGCDYNDKYFDGLDEMTEPANVIKLNYTLIDADYAAISDNKTNQSIAKEAGKDKALGYVKNDHYFTEDAPAATYVPAFLANKYYTADNGSSVKVTFNYKENKSELLSDYSSIKIYEPTNQDYAAIYGATAFAPYLNADTKNKLSDLLDGYKEPEEGDVVFIDYRVANGTSPDDYLKDPLLWENFSNIATGDLTTLKDWKNGGDWFISSKGGTEWKVTSYDNNNYLQYSAYKTEGECIAWLVTPEITLGTDDYLSFDVKVGNWNADCLTVLISKDFDGSNVDAADIWTDITDQFIIPSAPSKGYGDFASAGKFSLASYNGEKVYIAFKYTGDGVNKKTTTYQIDNIMIGTQLPVGSGLNSEPAYGLKVYNKGKWESQNKNVCLLSYADYIEMGLYSLNFTSEKPAVNYIPTYLASQVAYPLDGDVRVVVYRYNDGKQTTARSDEYVYSSEASKWIANSRIVSKTEQYVLSDGQWNYDPSTVITLNADKTDMEATTFYTAIVEWVKSNHKEFVTSFGNNEYYYGSSYYQNNFDFRYSAWKDYYDGKSEEEVKKLMWDRLPEAFIRALESLYADADMVSGIEVIYTINFAVYEGTNPAPTYTIKYKVVGKGKFEYIADSLQKQE